MSSDSLKHFGVLGMKWGVRRGMSIGNKIGTAIGQRIGPAIKKRVTNAHISKDDFKKMNDILNNPKSSKKQIEWALKKSGVEPKSGKPIREKKVSDFDIDAGRKRALAIMATVATLQVAKYVAMKYVQKKATEHFAAKVLGPEIVADMIKRGVKFG